MSEKFVTKYGQEIELVSSFKYLGFLLDDSLSFREHIQYVSKKLKALLGFLYRNKSCFSFCVKKRLVESCFLPVLDYGDVLYINTSAQNLHMLDSVYRGVLRFITNCGFLTHHCTLYSIVNWSALSTRWHAHWYLMTFK